MDLLNLLSYAREHQASDLHLTVGNPPMIRVCGQIHRLNVRALSESDMESVASQMITEDQSKRFAEEMEIDFAITHEQQRYRANLYHTINGISAAIRVIPEKIPNLQDLMVPNIVEKFTWLKKGLIVVTGATGSGKSTTLAAMIDYINSAQSRHIITIEDPVEYKFTSNKSLINQREVGASTKSFASALKNALRENPDIIMIGELRDLETIQLALSAAETGHLVFCTLHTSSAARTVDRMIDAFPSNDKPMIRAMLAESLEGVVSQNLLPRADGQSRVAAYEVMIANSAIRNLIREDKLYQIPSLMQIGSKQGMVLMEQSINGLYAKEMITEVVANEYKAKASSQDNKNTSSSSSSSSSSENLASAFSYQDNEF